MNSYKYKSSTIAFDERIKNTLAKIKRNHSNGVTKTKTEYAYEVKKAVYEFCKYIGKPTYRFIPASDVPSFLHYKDMVNNATSDMREIVLGCEGLNITLQDMNTEMTEELSFVNSHIRSIESDIDAIESKVESLSNASSMVFSDTFPNYEMTDSETDKIADVSEGTCKLQKVYSYSEKDFDIEILDTSNGFPGNTHEVYETSNGLKYVGEVAPRLNLSSIVSGSSNDWFEFEMYNIDDNTRLKTSDIGFRYKEGVEWISNDKELRLNLKITLKTPRLLNTFKIGGIAKLNKYTDNPVISEVIITDEYSTSQLIRFGRELDENTVINFKPQVVSEITVKIIQRDSNITKVARTYALSVDASKVPYFSSDDYEEYSKIDKPTISIEALGLKYNYKNKKIIYPSTSSGENFLSKEFIKSNLFYSDINTTSDKVMQTKIEEAYRYMIGISYINLEYNEYAKENIYISKPFKVEESIKRVTLTSNDVVPSSFLVKNDTNDKMYKPSFIRYYVSFNGEEEWHEISPRSSNRSGACSLVINSYQNIESRNSNTKYIDRLSDATSVRVKIELRRHDDIIDETPIIHQYSLDIDGEE